MTAERPANLPLPPGPPPLNRRLKLRTRLSPPRKKSQRPTIARLPSQPRSLPTNLLIGGPLPTEYCVSIDVGRSSVKIPTEQLQSQVFPALRLHRLPNSPRPEPQHLNRTNGRSEGSWAREGWGRSALNTRCAGRIHGCAEAS